MGSWRTVFPLVPLACLLAVVAGVMGELKAHVVTQLYGEWHEGERGWEMEVQFEAGYAVPEIRDDPAAQAPDREWLLALDEGGWEELREEAERYLRECLRIRDGDEVSGWEVAFVDFESRPPDFPRLLTNGAYLRMRLRPVEVPAGQVSLDWASGEDRPALVVKLPGEGGGYLTLDPGESRVMESGAKGELGWWTSFRQGFRHVVPDGWDHVLFVMGLFFYRRKWRPLLMQSLAFTAAHTVTLGLATAGMVKVSGNWVEPVIALSLTAVALENFRAKGDGAGWGRLAVVFGFGLIHGLGFAGALSEWLRPGEGFLPALLSANLGVEAAQASLLAGAWVLTLGWWRTPAYRRVRWTACLGIAITGVYWALERVGWIG